MATQLQLRKGTTSDNDSFIGAEGELTYDTETKGLRIHDGVTQGGNLIDTVVDFQLPTAENNYTWYRLYSSGWVEQGGLTTDNESTTHNLEIPMADTNYVLVVMNKVNGNYYSKIVSMSTTGFIADPSYGSNTKSGMWQVSGMAA